MPKSKRKPLRAQQATTQNSNTQNVKPWVKWVAIVIVALLGISVIAGAITATPAHAEGIVSDVRAATSPTCLLDTDHDGIANPDDPDIDGDGIVNGLDNDIDGDGIINSKDGDPASTNCVDSAPPIMPNGASTTVEGTGAWGIYVTFAVSFAVVAVIVITLFSKRQKKG